MNTSDAANDLRAALEDNGPPVSAPNSTPLDRLGLLLEAIENPALRNACGKLFDYVDFHTWPASLSHHHAYEGGLRTHTLEVAELALHAAESFPKVDRDVLIAASLWHDLGKIWEYELTDSPMVGFTHPRHLEKGFVEGRRYRWVETLHRDLIGHIQSSAQAFCMAAYAHRVDDNVAQQIAHCILAHHGPVREWGSPVAPQTLEAWLLHHADMLSARYGATK